MPVTSIVLISIWAALLAASGTFDQLTNMAVLSYAIFWIPVVLSVIVLRRKLPNAPRPYRVKGYPFVPLPVRARHVLDRGERLPHESRGVGCNARAHPAWRASVSALPRQRDRP